jgi:hypothetical protein
MQSSECKPKLNKVKEVQEHVSAIQMLFSLQYWLLKTVQQFPNPTKRKSSIALFKVNMMIIQSQYLENQRSYICRISLLQWHKQNCKGNQCQVKPWPTVIAIRTEFHKASALQPRIIHFFFFAFWLVTTVVKMSIAKGCCRVRLKAYKHRPIYGLEVT